MSSLGDAATNLINDVRVREIFINRGYCECDDLDSMSSGSMSPDLGDTWHQGLPREYAVGGNSKEDDSCTASDSTAWRDHTDAISTVREKSVWNLIRDSLCPPDVLRLRTVGRERNEVKLFGDFAALWFSLVTNKDETISTEPPEWQSPRLDSRDNFGFVPGR